MSVADRLPPFEQTIGAVLIAAKEAVIAPLRPILREFNVTEPQWRVMRVVNDRAPIDATSIAEIGQLRAPSVTRILRELEDRGLIERAADENDRRRALVVLSKEGQEMVNASAQRMLYIMSEYSNRFGAQRLEQLTDELRALSSAVGDIK